MPSPFPGMDPYFEGELWTSFHTQFGVEIARQLTPKLAPCYIARAEKRYIVQSVEDLAVEIEEVIPDVGIRQTRDKTISGTSLKSTLPTLELATIMPSKIPHVWVEIRDAKLRKLVTAIEILSPTNKIGRGRREYLHKRARILRSTAHLLEIDLIRKGRRLPMRKKLPSDPYFVFLSRRAQADHGNLVHFIRSTTPDRARSVASGRPRRYVGITEGFDNGL